MKINYIEDIIIVDDLFSFEEIKILEQWAYTLESYKLTSDETNRVFSFSSFPSNDDETVSYVLNKFKENFNFKIPNFDRVLVNLFKQLDFCDTHKDAGYDYGISFIVYLNTKWEHYWGGETYFSKSPDPDFTISVIPKPGRVVISPIYMYHGSRPSTTLSESIGRLTMVFQYSGYEGDIYIQDILKSFMENSDA
jgi:hypothetical protein